MAGICRKDGTERTTVRAPALVYNKNATVDYLQDFCFRIPLLTLCMSFFFSFSESSCFAVSTKFLQEVGFPFQTGTKNIGKFITVSVFMDPHAKKQTPRTSWEIRSHEITQRGLRGRTI